MKKNLRIFLTLALGFVTVIATAQTWDGNSRTRVNMGGDNDQFQSEQRTSLGVSWGGNGWGINLGGAHYYNMDNNDGGNFEWQVANASTNIMDFATVTVGRQALNYGSGAIMGSNDWGGAGSINTHDGGVFAINNDMLGLDLGVYKNNGGGEDEDGTTNYFVNASKSDGDWSMNLLYISNDNGEEDGASSAMGLDLGYAMMGGDLDLAVSYNTASSDVAEDMDMMSIGATYNVNDDMSVSATRTTYGDNGFEMTGSNIGGWDTHGNMGYLGANDEDMAFGVSYAMGDFTLGLSMHNITNTENEDAERSVTQANFDYSMSNNASVGIQYASDDASGEDVKYMWLTLSVTP